ncbi:MAG: 5'/3'-nucleotidase SurE [Polaromonas sp.]|uniref:5'/3'-nucleotidase SurE n=1 Tax=Polaromonas sp. TaxID=1869339 RepID=UPI0027331AB6|nr:5'/3'-nucleotidase SurE [Polaromonas sp.]MDP3799679.1 5'/3'-nucleotidase SurE [Polaromonas sp.]
MTSTMRILVSNDDGHFSPGLAALERAAASLSDDVWVVAPHDKRSSMGHSISLHEPFTMTRLDVRRYACSGTPADCAIAAFAWLFADSLKPTLVLSGINDGRNIGEDIAYSGTMAIAREASFWGVPAIGFSAPNGSDFESPEVAAWLARLVRHFGETLEDWHHPDTWLSINLPAVLPAPLRHASPGRAKIAATITAEKAGPDTTLLRYDRGRLVAATAGDEQSQLEAGFATVYRLRWNGYACLEDSLLGDVNDAALKITTPE